MTDRISRALASLEPPSHDIDIANASPELKDGLVVELQTDWNVPRSQHAIYYRDTKNAERPIDIAMGLFNAASQ